MNISKLTLGTAQLGLEYGVANKIGKPTKRQCFQMLDFAFEHGITTLDTAVAYGESEAIIGEWISATNCNPLIISKISLDELKEVPENKVSGILTEILHRSLESLNIDNLWGVLLHSCTGREKCMIAVVQALTELKNINIVSHVGASLYDPVEFFEMQSLKALDTYQVPVNVFDQRFLCEEVTSCSAGKNLFARSIFLQGLLTLSEEDAEKKVRGSGHFISQLAQLSVQYSIPVRNMLVAYVKSFPFINSIVLGMETLEQVKQNVCLLADSSLPPNLFLEIQNRFSSMPSEIIDPRVWNNER